MHLIKSGQIIADSTQHLDDETGIPAAGVFTVSFNRWSEHKDDLLAQAAGRIGIRINGDDPLETLQPDLAHFALIALEFPAFTDGRCFSFARSLRERMGYGGEIRAVGDFLRDQVHYLSRVGFDAFEYADLNAAEQALSALTEFSVHYQVSSDQDKVVRHQLSGSV